MDLPAKLLQPLRTRRKKNTILQQIDFSADKEDQDSLGDVDTDIEEEEANNFKADISMPTARKKSMTSKKTDSKTDHAISALSGQMGKLNFSKVKYDSLDWRFPMSMSASAWKVAAT
jgi:hypothetical protein